METNSSNKFFFLLLFSLFLLGIIFSCNKKVSPENTAAIQLSKEEMISVLTDMHLLESALSLRRNRGQSTHELKESWYTQLFERYNITANIFEENLSYYNDDPAVMEKILEEVMANLSRLQSELDSELATKPKSATHD
ncbi:MAG: DUF4296 domain-containing protein [Bacteroidales bacterium]|nr:DUF4296 domain-containing protein [Bacteroidales bacterium]